MKELNMNLRIKRITEDYPYQLLLLADETITAIHKYLLDSEVYVAINPDNDTPIAICCLYAIDRDTIELKNVAVANEYQSKGVGSYLIDRAVEMAREKGYKEMIVGTGDCGFSQIRFYEKNGFVKYGVKENFFIDNYDSPIHENGIMLKDMVMLKKAL